MTPGCRASLAQLRRRGVVTIAGDRLELRGADGLTTWRELDTGLWECVAADEAPRGLRLV